MIFSHVIPAIVVDASVTVPLVTGVETWIAKWSTWAEQDVFLLAPDHYPAEVANALLRGTDVAAAQVPLKLLHVARTGVDTTNRSWRGLVDAVVLADRHRLSVYDALYLQLALEIEAPLATIDRALAAAAVVEGVEVIGESG